MDESESPPATYDANSGFPLSPSNFDSDSRIYYSMLDNKFILGTEAGEEFEYVEGLKRWVPVVDEALLEQQGEAYRVQGVDENEPATGHQKKKRKGQHANGEEENGQGKVKKARVNTAVYVTSIPLDATIDEVHEVFSKCGVINKEIDSDKPRIKMYTDEDANFKGDALIVYFRPESVKLASQMLDDSDFRFGVAGPEGKMKVQAADFSFKSQQEAPAKTSNKDKKKIIRKMQRMNNKLADWDDDDPSTLPDTTSKWDKLVILKHMFTLKELEEDPGAILDIKEDIRDECSKLGEVTNVVLFDKEQDGVSSVRFATPEAAVACVKMMDGRFFSGTKVEAYIANGTEKFKKTSEKKTNLDDDDEEADERLDRFGNWLEEDNGDAA